MCNIDFCTMPLQHFYHAMPMHSMDYAVARCPSVRSSVCPSLTRRYSVDTAEHIFIIFSQSGSHTILVSDVSIMSVLRIIILYMCYRWQPSARKQNTKDWSW